LELRAHAGPSVGPTEITSAQEFLKQHEFSPTSDYFSRLTRLQSELRSRPATLKREKRNYGGEAAGCWMQLQSVYDHVILSTCYDGRFNTQRGRIKISHRFNEAGRIDFVELKFLRSLQACLTGELRKLVMVKNYQAVQRDWHEAEAFALRVLPQELIFLFAEIFRCPKTEVLAGLINIGHGMAGDLSADLNGEALRQPSTQTSVEQAQLCLTELQSDEVAMPILERAAALESVVELSDDKSVVIRYHRI